MYFIVFRSEMMLDSSGGDGDVHHSDNGKMFRSTNGCPPPINEPYSPPKVTNLMLLLRRV